MAKRRADDMLIPSSPSKRCRVLSSVDLRLETLAPSGVSPPSLLALLGNRCRKRHFYFDEIGTDFDLALSPKSAHGECGLLKHTMPNTMQQQTSGNFQDRRISSVTKATNKRPREDSEASAETTYPKAMAEVNPEAPNSHEDNYYNSFQFWRTPLPELDMSLLERPPQKDPDTMET